jgi:hypothetical protein
VTLLSAITGRKKIKSVTCQPAASPSKRNNHRFPDSQYRRQTTRVPQATVLPSPLTMVATAACGRNTPAKHVAIGDPNPSVKHDPLPETGQVPQTERFVFASGQRGATVGREGDGIDPPGMPCEGADYLSGSPRLSKANTPVLSGGPPESTRLFSDRCVRTSLYNSATQHT